MSLRASRLSSTGSDRHQDSSNPAGPFGRPGTDLSTSLSEFGTRLFDGGVDHASDGGPEAATVIVGGEVAGNTGTSHTITIGDSVLSQIEASGDQDWFAVQLPAGVTYEFTLAGTGGDILDDPYLS